MQVQYIFFWLIFSILILLIEAIFIIYTVGSYRTDPREDLLPKFELNGRLFTIGSLLRLD